MKSQVIRQLKFQFLAEKKNVLACFHKFLKALSPRTKIRLVGQVFLDLKPCHQSMTSILQVNPTLGWPSLQRPPLSIGQLQKKKMVISIAIGILEDYFPKNQLSWFCSQCTRGISVNVLNKRQKEPRQKTKWLRGLFIMGFMRMRQALWKYVFQCLMAFTFPSGCLYGVEINVFAEKHLCLLAKPTSKGARCITSG